MLETTSFLQESRRGDNLLVVCDNRELRFGPQPRGGIRMKWGFFAGFPVCLGCIFPSLDSNSPHNKSFALPLNSTLALNSTLGGTQMAKASEAPKPLTKTELFATLAEKTDLSKKQVAELFDALTEVIEGSLKKGGPGILTLPGLMKIKTRVKQATPARQMPKPGDPSVMIDVPAKPAKTEVKVTVLKGLKEMVA